MTAKVPPVSHSSAFVLLLSGSLLGFVLRISAQAPASHALVAEHYHRAELALARGDNAAASLEFNAILEIEPRNSSAYANLGVLAYKRGALSEAKADLQQALEASPELWDANALLGLCEAGLGEDSAALLRLEKAFPFIHDHGVKLDAGLALLTLHRNNGTLAEALPIANELERSAPSNPEVLYSVYHVYSDLAASSLTRLRTAAPISGRFYQVLGEASLAQDDFPGAIAAFRKALAAQPDLPGVHFVLGTTLLTNAQDESSREAARGEFEAELARNPQDYHSEFQLGEVERLSGHADLAESRYKRAIALHSAYPEAQAALGSLLIDKKQDAAALVYLRTAVQLDPNNETYHYRLSRLYQSLNQPEDARREMEVFRKLHQP